jgi:hypothetical protein
MAAAYAMPVFATDATRVSSSGTPLAQTGIDNAFANTVSLAALSTGTALTTTSVGNGVLPQNEIDTLTRNEKPSVRIDAGRARWDCNVRRWADRNNLPVIDQHDGVCEVVCRVSVVAEGQLSKLSARPQRLIRLYRVDPGGIAVACGSAGSTEVWFHCGAARRSHHSRSA